MKDTEFAKEIQEIIDGAKKQPGRLNERLNLKLYDCSREEKMVAFAFDVEEWCLNPYGGVHGGAICSLFDTAMGMGATVMGGYMVTTTDLSVSYLKPMNGKRYIFQGEYTHVGRRMVRCISRAIDAETGVLCATAQISYMLTETKSRGIQV